MNGRRTVLAVAVALAALLALATAGAVSLAASRTAGPPNLDKRIAEVRDLIEHAIKLEEGPLVTKYWIKRQLSSSADLLEEADDLLDDPPFQPFRQPPEGWARGWVVEAEMAVQRAAQLDRLANNKIRGEDLDDDVKEEIRQAIQAKERALRHVPRVESSGCETTRESAGQTVTTSTGGCEKPVSTVVVQSTRPLQFTNYSLVTPGGSPAHRPANCKQVSKTAVVCRIKPPLRPNEIFYADFAPPVGKVQVTTCHTVGRVTGCKTTTV